MKREVQAVDFSNVVELVSRAVDLLGVATIVIVIRIATAGSASGIAAGLWMATVPFGATWAAASSSGSRSW